MFNNTEIKKIELKEEPKSEQKVVDMKDAPLNIPFIDRSDILLSQMNFIALNNKSFINFTHKQAC